MRYHERIMALRPMASGTVSFGLVAIPVKLFSTTETAKTVRFNQVHTECGTRVKNQLYCPTDDRTVERSELSKGYEFTKGKYVLFDKEELKAINPEPTNSIEIKEFVPLDQVDPIYFEKSYYLGPDKGGAKPYALLSQAMRQSNRAALARYAARGKDYLVLLRPFKEGMIMQQLNYADEIRDFGEVPLGDAEPSEAEVAMAMMVVEQIANDKFEPEKYEDTVRNQVWELIERKIQGEQIVAPPQEEPQAQIIDLMEALKASLGQSDGERKPPRGASEEAEEPKAAAGGG